MITLIFGRPGTGKTYEAVKYHILPNQKRENKVITNIPVSVSNSNLVIIEEPKIVDIVKIIDASNVELTFVLDEFQFLLKEDEEAWFQLFAQHRKFRTDFIIITQSPLSLPQKMYDLISFSHKITHNPFFLKKLTYIKKVYDGIPVGDRVIVLNSKLRFYSKKIFLSYQSFYKRDYVKTGNLFQFDNKSHIMVWPLIATITIIFLIYNFSVDRNFNLKSYITHSSPRLTAEAEAKTIDDIHPILLESSEDELLELSEDKLLESSEDDVANNNHSDRTLINLLFNSKIFITGWHYDKGTRVSYFDVWQKQLLFKITSENKIFENIAIQVYEDCLVTFEYQSKIKVVPCFTPKD